MKKNVLILVVLFISILLLGGCSKGLNYKDVKKIDEKTYKIETKPEKIIIDLSKNNKNKLKYNITNNNEDNVKEIVKEYKDYVRITISDVQKGDTYRIEVSEGSFRDKNLKDAEKLVIEITDDIKKEDNSNKELFEAISNLEKADSYTMVSATDFTMKERNEKNHNAVTYINDLKNKTYKVNITDQYGNSWNYLVDRNKDRYYQEIDTDIWEYSDTKDYRYCEYLYNYFLPLIKESSNITKKSNGEYNVSLTIDELKILNEKYITDDENGDLTYEITKNMDIIIKIQDKNISSFKYNIMGNIRKDLQDTYINDYYVTIEFSNYNKSEYIISEDVKTSATKACDLYEGNC